MRVIILFFCLMFAFNGFSQKVRERQVLFKIAPLALIDDFGLPAIQGGLEIPVAKNISWYNEFGIRYRKSIAETADTNFVTPGGYRVKSEVRYYFNNIKDKVNRRVPGLSKRFYAAVDLFCIKSARNVYLGYYYQKDTSIITDDNFGVKKEVWGGNLIAGYQVDLRKRFVFEFYGGLGVRVRNIVTVNREFDYNRDQKWQHAEDWISNIYKRPELKDGKKTMLNFSLGIRVAYRLF